ncbi:hypothetical protein BOX15_Mlig021608g1 [Macrostomum lignano]|uniref:Calponin-homology (CH) domain-containing protein n=2 Tax=Macrostomum lignano TaxID=282301 RepID=A0A267G8T2_9PLAT|nr:hypothetical protein BOX15_Mlig021608g1 [Macrostomum lignano]
MSSFMDDNFDRYDYDYYDDEGGYTDEDEMLGADRDLAEDAEWKIIQKNTFTRWVNERLKDSNKYVTDLQCDLADGLKLLALVETLSGHKFRHANKRPTFRTQKLENVTMTLKFLEEQEGLRLVNIDSSDIVDCKMKLILGLIWTLILHYSIAMPMWEGEDEYLKDGKVTTPRQRLMGWINAKMSGKRVQNFTTDWNDGTAIGALVDACAPGLCPDWDAWDRGRPVENCTEAMDAAEQWMDVPQLIRPEEMANPRVDEKAMMTYLAQFPSARLKPGAPLQPRTNPERVRAYGPGLESQGNTVGAPARFTVETFGAGKGQLDVAVVSPLGTREPCEAVFNNDRSLTYSCSYTPTVEGEHRVHVLFAQQEVPGSPFAVGVETSVGDPTRVTANGPGIEPHGNEAGKRTHFSIFTAGAGPGSIGCVILDPHGQRDSVKLRVSPKSDQQGAYLVEYVPRDDGLHSVNVFFAGQQIPGSPFGVEVAKKGGQQKPEQQAEKPLQAQRTQQQQSSAARPAHQPHLAYVTGRGVQRRGVRVGQKADFRVHTEKAGPGADCQVQVIGPGGSMEPCRQDRPSEAVIACDYRPVRAGRHTVIVKYAGSEVPRSPFTVEVGPAAETRVRAFGPGLEAGWVDEPAIFSVETNGEGELDFVVEGPPGHGGEVHVEARDKGGGAMDVAYYPSRAGEHAVHIIGPDGEDIAASPYMSNIGERRAQLRPELVSARGPGIGVPDSQGLALHSVAAFAVDASASGGPPDLLRVTVHNCRGEPVQADCLPRGPGLFQCGYVPQAPGRYTTSISYSGVSIPGSPFRVQLAEPVRPDLVRVGGPGVKRAVRRKPTVFTVDSSRAGPGETLTLVRLEATGVELPVKRVGTGTPGLYRVEYTPPQASPVTVEVTHAGQPAGGSPFRVPVEPDIDLDKVHVLGLESHVYRDSYPKFRVDASAVESTVNPAESGGAAAALVSGRTGRPVAEVQVRSQGAGLYECAYRPREAGPHRMEVTYAGLPVPGSPFPVEVASGCDPGRVRAHGPGLRSALVGEPAGFTVDFATAGQGDLTLAVLGPGQAPVKYRDNGDGTWAVQYTPSERGPHEVQVKFADCHVPGSPFPVPVESRPAPDRVTAYGPGLQSGRVRAGQLARFTVDATAAGPGHPSVRVGQAMGPAPCSVAQAPGQPAGLFSAAYEPLCEGPAEVAVTFAGQPIPGSPFRVAVRPRCEPGAVVATGPGVRPPGGPSGSLPASLPAAFKVDARDAGPGELRVAVADPDGRAVPVSTEVLSDNGGGGGGDTGGGGVTACCYTPHLTGVHTVTVTYEGQHVPGSPFAVRSEATGDADKVRLLVPPQATVVADTEASIMVDASGAGDGGITCRITTSNDSELDIDLEENADGTVSLYYTPRIPGMQAIEIRFGGQLIPDGELQQMVIEEAEIVEKQEQKLTSSELPPAGPRYPEIDFGLTFDASTSARGGAIDALIRTPSGTVHQPEVTPPDADGRCSFVYRPSEIGQHELQVLMDGQPVAGSPFKFYVDCLGLGHVTAYGPGLCYGRSGEPANFTVVTKEAGPGGLALAVEGPSRAEISCHDNKDGTCDVNYLPLTPGDYTVIVKFLDRHVLGSPFTARIVEEPKGRAELLMVGRSGEIPLRIAETDLAGLTATVTDPGGSEEACQLRRLANGRLGVAFSPRIAGPHRVSVIGRSGRPVAASPFVIAVAETDLANAARVRAYGDCLDGLAAAASVGRPCEFRVDTSGAGYGGLSVSVEGPGRAEVDCADCGDGVCLVSFTPSAPGSYSVSVQFAERHVPGSPWTVTVAGSVKDVGSNGLSGPELEAEGPGLRRGGVGIGNEFRVQARGAGALGVAVEGPSKAQIEFNDHRGDGWCAIAWTVPLPGLYAVSVTLDGRHAPGSPFQVPVGDWEANGGGSRRAELVANSVVAAAAAKVRVRGEGLHRARVGQRASFLVATADAPSGALAVTIDGPSKVQLNCREMVDGYEFFYTPTTPGHYLVGIRYGDECHIQGSPFAVHVTGGTPASAQFVDDGLNATANCSDHIAAEPCRPSELSVRARPYTEPLSTRRPPSPSMLLGLGQASS